MSSETEFNLLVSAIQDVLVDLSPDAENRPYWYCTRKIEYI